MPDNQRTSASGIQTLTDYEAKPVLIGCCPSSGSTLLSVILDAHPSLLCGPELTLFCHPFFWTSKGDDWRDPILGALNSPGLMLENWVLENGYVPYAHILDVPELTWYEQDFESFTNLVKQCDSGPEFADKFFLPLLQSRNKKIWIEKSPANLYGISHFLNVYSNGKAIIIVRDGRDVVCSLRKRGYSFGSAVNKWLFETAISLELAKSSRVHLVRYEDLILSPKETLSKITAFLGVEEAFERLLDYTRYTTRNLNDPRESMHSWTNKLGDGITASSLKRWASEFSNEELEIFYSYKIRENHAPVPHIGYLPELTTRDLLNEFGYDIPPASTTMSWKSLSCYLSNEEYPFAHVTNVGKLHQRYTRLNFPNEFDSSVAPADVVLLIEKFLPTYIPLVLKESLDTQRRLETQVNKLESELNKHKQQHLKIIFASVQQAIRTRVENFYNNVFRRNTVS